MTAITAVMLRQSGATLQLNPSDFEIRLSSGNTGVVTFTRTKAP